jgi:hypothetical protein
MGPLEMGSEPGMEDLDVLPAKIEGATPIENIEDVLLSEDQTVVVEAEGQASGAHPAVPPITISPTLVSS